MRLAGFLSSGTGVHMTRAELRRAFSLAE